MASLELTGIDKEYAGGVQAVRGVDLRVADGELVVFVGPSGCGKSTLLRMIAGLEEITRGTLRIGERVANDLTPQERNVAMVFQDYALYPHLTVRGNLEFPLRMRGMARAERERRVAETAGMLGIDALLDRLPRAISGGQRQRVAMGRALVRQPAVFLLDEPLSNLDARLRSEVRGEIRRLQQRTRTTMLYVTHDQAEAMTLGDRVVVLDRGVVQQVGTPEEMYREPANVFVAGFVGTPPMNLAPARLRIDGDLATIEVGGATLRVMPTRALPEAWRAHAGAALQAGFHAEDVAIVAAADAEAMAARVEAVEFLGHESLLHLVVPTGAAAAVVRLVARQAGAGQARPGDPVALQVHPGRLRLFAADGRALGSA